jgi:hypothetical protein
MRRIGALSLAVALFLLPVQSRADDWLDGTWEGVVKIDRGAHPFDNRTGQKIRIQIVNDVAHMFIYENGTFVAYRPELFRVLRLGPNALIYTSDGGDVWPHKAQSEIISYAVTRAGTGHILVEYARVGQVSVDEILSGTTNNLGERGEGDLKQAGN